MKLRIAGNDIRLRLSRAEVAQISQGEALHEAVALGSAYPAFRYSLVVQAGIPALAVQYENHQLQVSIPEELARQWATTHTISLENTLTFNNGDTLHVLIEKDLHDLRR